MWQEGLKHAFTRNSFVDTISTLLKHAFTRNSFVDTISTLLQQLGGGENMFEGCVLSRSGVLSADPCSKSPERRGSSLDQDSLGKVCVWGQVGLHSIPKGSFSQASFMGLRSASWMSPRSKLNKRPTMNGSAPSASRSCRICTLFCLKMITWWSACFLRSRRYLAPSKVRVTGTWHARRLPNAASHEWEQRHPIS